MRNLAEKWTAPPNWTTAEITIPGLVVKTRPGLFQNIVSGNLAGWAQAAKMPAVGVGAFSPASGEAYCAQIARDRLLAVTARPLEVASGWHEAGFAVTPVSAGLHVFAIRGEATSKLIARASTLAPETHSASSALMFGGVSAIVYRHDEDLLVHVDRGLATYLWVWMQKAAANISMA